jgi:hypothetical protein
MVKIKNAITGGDVWVLQCVFDYEIGGSIEYNLNPVDENNGESFDTVPDDIAEYYGLKGMSDEEIDALLLNDDGLDDDSCQ